MGGIVDAGAMQLVTGLVLPIGLTWFNIFGKTAPLYMAAVAFPAYGIHWFAMAHRRFIDSSAQPDAWMAMAYFVLSVLGVVIFIGAGDISVAIVFIGLSLIYLTESPYRFGVFAGGGRLVAVWQLLTGIWLMYLTWGSGGHYLSGLALVSIASISAYVNLEISLVFHLRLILLWHCHCTRKEKWQCQKNAEIGMQNNQGYPLPIYTLGCSVRLAINCPRRYAVAAPSSPAIGLICPLPLLSMPWKAWFARAMISWMLFVSPGLLSNCKASRSIVVTQPVIFVVPASTSPACRRMFAVLSDCVAAREAWVAAVAA